MKNATKYLVLLALAVVMGGSAFGESLKDLAEQEGVSWLAGRWKATTDEGEEISLSYRWAVEGNAIIVDTKIGEVTSHGMIYFSEDEQQVKQISVDSKGKVTKSTWDVQYGKLVLKTSMTDEYGQTEKMGITFEKTNDKTMKVELYNIEYGELSYNSWAQLEFKRQVRPAPRTTARPAKRPAKADKAKK
ncbi:MAG: hypothetical protein KAS23_01990 [Anaerohalosphaera sp.]|nr:hypothetical protein [Anaerohalosphaera sp.]